MKSSRHEAPLKPSRTRTRMIQMPEPAATGRPSVSLEAVMSFLKETRGPLTWTSRDMTDSLKIREAESNAIIDVGDAVAAGRTVHFASELRRYVGGNPAEGVLTAVLLKRIAPRNSALCRISNLRRGHLGCVPYWTDPQLCLMAQHGDQLASHAID